MQLFSIQTQIICFVAMPLRGFTKKQKNGKTRKNLFDAWLFLVFPVFVYN